MIKCADLRPGDIIFWDESPKRSILVVHIQEDDGTAFFADWKWAMWWLDVTSVNGFKMLTSSRPVGPWNCSEEIPFHRDRSERNVHDANGDPEGDSASS